MPAQIPEGLAGTAPKARHALSRRLGSGLWGGLLLLVCLLPSGGVTNAAQGVAHWADVLNLGDTFSVYSYGQAPYNRSAPFLELQERKLFSRGSEKFNGIDPDIVSALSGIGQSASANATSCESCHFRDGRGRVHSQALDVTGLSVVNTASAEGPAVFRIPSRSDGTAARLTGVRWKRDRLVTLSGGETVELVTPVAHVDGAERAVDLRNAPGVYGLGLLEAVPEVDIVDQARARSYEAFGVAGRVPVAEGADGEEKLGRFGWKATHASLPDLVRSALTKELGIGGGRQSAGPGDGNDAFASFVTDISGYLRRLAVPARRLDSDDGHRAGAGIFVDIGCAMCHRPAWQTGGAGTADAKYRGLTIFPFTDMLLHDMGPGLSAPSDTALGRYWRTAPLWGIGVQHGVAGDAGFLHDGRARTLTEAILWHGGEAGHAVDGFKSLTAEERKRLVAFLSSL
ncbi:MAG: di-heme oxidoredictase family protein [Roseibium sp.]